jgi:hypothetical protein
MNIPGRAFVVFCCAFPSRFHYNICGNHFEAALCQQRGVSSPLAKIFAAGSRALRAAVNSLRSVSYKDETQRTLRVLRALWMRQDKPG